MLYIIQDREAGNIIEHFHNKEEAEKTLEAYEEDNRKDGTYTPDFYEIVTLPTYIIQEPDGNLIEEYNDLGTAIYDLNEWEEIDRRNGEYTPGAYEIWEETTPGHWEKIYS